jgi:arylsulfatase A-like enzyme
MRLTRTLLHAIPLAAAVALVARTIGLVAYCFGGDPAGHANVAAPLDALVVALPYHLAVLAALAAAALLLWLVARPLRGGVTVAAIVLFAVTVLMGQIDFDMLRQTGSGLTLSAIRTYAGARLWDSAFLQPVLFEPGYTIPSLALIAGSWLAMAAGMLRAVRRRAAAPTVATCALFAAVAGVLALRVSAVGPKAAIIRPPEMSSLIALAGFDQTAPPADEAAAMVSLRAAISGRREAAWLDEAYPLVHRGHARLPRSSNLLDQPDIILLVVESLRGHDVGYSELSRGPSPTPNLDGLAARGVVFPHLISNGFPSAPGFMALNTSTWPHREKVVASHFPTVAFDALPLRLHDAGYRTVSLFGSNPSFDNILVWARRWYDRQIFELPENTVLYTRRMSDAQIVDRLLEVVADHDRETPERPLFVFAATAGTHKPYTLEDSYFVPLTAAGDADRVSTGGIVDPEARYKIVLANLDREIGRLLAALDRRPRHANTLIVVVGDHAHSTTEVLGDELKGLPTDDSVWTSAILAGPTRLLGRTPRRETFACSQADLMPTILAMVGDDRATAAMGTDLFDEEAPRTAVAIREAGYRLDKAGFSLLVRSDRPASYWTDRPFQAVDAFSTTLEGTPFSPADIATLDLRARYLSYLIERNRIWRDAFLRR